MSFKPADTAFCSDVEYEFILRSNKTNKACVGQIGRVSSLTFRKLLDT